MTKSRVITSLLLVCLVSLFIIGSRNAGLLEGFELSVYDWQLYFRPSLPEDEARVIFLKITENDIQKLGRWPIADETLSQIFDELIGAEASVIGLDIYRDIAVPPGHDQLNSRFLKHDNIIVVKKFPHGNSPGVAAPRVLKGSEQVGFNDLLVDSDGIVRRAVLYLNKGAEISTSFALRLTEQYLRGKGIAIQGDEKNPNHIKIGEVTIPPFETNDGSYVGADAAGYQFLLDYRSSQSSLPSINVGDLISGAYSKDLVKDKIVIIGAAAESLADHFWTPLNVFKKQSQALHGAELHAYIANQLLNMGLHQTKPLSIWSDIAESLWIVFWGLVGGVLVFVAPSMRETIFMAGLGLILLLALSQGFFIYGWWVPLLPPLFSFLAALGVVAVYLSSQEKRDRQSLMQLFSSHLSPELAKTIWGERKKFLRGGRPRPERLVATAFFTDLVGFTATSEALKPSVLVDWLNDYMGKMVPVVSQHQGVILRFAGDAIVAAFGIPIARVDQEAIRVDAVNAVRCALAMQRALIDLNKDLITRELPTATMRIGIDTGQMVAGSLGSSKRFEYTVIGQTVTTAARLESYDKTIFPPEPLSAPCRILIGQSTRDLLGEQFDLEAVGEVQLKGQSLGLKIYRVRGERGISPQ